MGSKEKLSPTGRKSRRRFLLSGVAAFVWGAAASPVLGAGSRIEIGLSRNISYGEPVILTVRIVNPEEEGLRPSLPPVKGLRIEGPFYGGTEQRTVIVNGRTESSYSLRYQYRISPLGGSVGRFTIGPVTVKRSGKPPLRSATVTLLVARKPGLALRFTCELSRTEGEVGEPFRVVYKVCYPADSLGSGFRLPRLPILELPGVKVKPVPVFPGRPVDRADYGNTYLLVQDDVVNTESGEALQALCFAFEVTPLRVGNLVIPPAVVEADLKTGRFRIQRDLLGYPVGRVPEVRTFRAETKEKTYKVKPLPVQGRPPGFTGAVGRFSIEVTTDDREVNTFDPIRLTVTIRGEGLLEEVTLPAWGELPWLTENFEVAREVDPGTLKGGAKVFHQTIRPLKPGITAIPALPFPYYDPWRKQYAVAHSKPIPIVVRQVQTVSAKEAYRKEPAGKAPVEAVKPKEPAIVATEGVSANFLRIGPVTGYINPRRLLGSWVFRLAAFFPPLLFAGFFLALKLSRRDPALQARRTALKKAIRAVQQAGGDIEALAEAYQGYFRDKFGLPPGELTPAQVAGALAARGVDADLTAKARGHLEVLLAARFGGGSGGVEQERLSERTLALLREVEKCAS